MNLSGTVRGNQITLKLNSSGAGTGAHSYLRVRAGTVYKVAHETNTVSTCCFAGDVSVVDHCDCRAFDLSTWCLTPVSTGPCSAIEGSSAVSHPHAIVRMSKVDRVSPVKVHIKIPYTKLCCNTECLVPFLGSFLEISVVRSFIAFLCLSI